jgi:cytochrome P450
MDSHNACPVSGVGAAGSEEDVGGAPLTYPFDPPAALEPAPEWARLRADCPVAPVQLASGDQVMLLTRYEDVRALLADPRCTRDLGAEDAAQITATESGVFNNSRTSAMDAEAMRTMSGNGP